jgi:hypothetical protein
MRERLRKPFLREKKERERFAKPFPWVFATSEPFKYVLRESQNSNNTGTPTVPRIGTGHVGHAIIEISQRICTRYFLLFPAHHFLSPNWNRSPPQRSVTQFFFPALNILLFVNLIIYNCIFFKGQPNKLQIYKFCEVCSLNFFY